VGNQESLHPALKNSVLLSTSLALLTSGVNSCGHLNAPPLRLSGRSTVEPAFAEPDAKRKAIAYACQRFGGGAGKVHVYGDDAANIERSIVIDGRGQYPQVVCD